jgi:hypothetical protein
VAAVQAMGGEVRFTRDTTFSSTSLLNAYFRVPPDPETV